MYYSILLPTLPLAGEFGPTVVESCLDLLCGGIYYSGFLLTRLIGVGKLGGGSSEYSRTMVQKFFNRSPITLKFGAEKLERESQESESESESEQVVVFLRSYVDVVVFLHS